MRNFKNSHPSVILFYFFSAVFFATAYSHPVTVFLCLICSFMLSVDICGGKKTVSLLLKMLPLQLITVLLNVLTSHYGENNMLELPDGNFMTLEALTFGIITAIKLTAIILLCFSFSEISTSEMIRYVIGMAFKRTALVLGMALRFLPLYVERTRDTRLALKGIGLLGKGTGFKTRIYSGIRVLNVMFSRSIEGAIITSDSMISRGYSGKGTYRRRHDIKPCDVFVLLLFFLFFAILLLGLFKRVLYFSCAPVFYFSSLNIFSYIVLTSHFCFYISPVFLDVTEAIRWRYYLRKI